MYKIKFKTFRFIIISYLALVFQATLINSISIASVKPEVVLLLVVFFSLYNGSKQGMFCGMILGFGIDVLSGGIVGINSFILGCVGFFCGLLKERVYTTHFLTKILVSSLSCCFSIICYYIIAGRFYRLPAFGENFAVILGVVVYTTLFNMIFSNFLDRMIIERSTLL